MVDRNLTYSVNNLNQYTTASGTAPATFSHDLNGNMTNDGAGGTYAYDALNRLTSASGTNSATLVYGPKGRLIRTTAGGTTTEFLYDGDALIAEYVSGAVTNRYAHGGGVDDPVVWYEGAGTATKNYITTDERGSIIGLTDASGANTRINAYDEWGNPAASNIGRFQYTGQIWLSEIGKYYYKARIYDPKLGWFLQTDPIGYDDGMNMYAYFRNDPVNGWDPSGTTACWRVKACDGKGVIEGFTADAFESGTFYSADAVTSNFNQLSAGEQDKARELADSRGIDLRDYGIQSDDASQSSMLSGRDFLALSTEQQAHLDAIMSDFDLRTNMDAAIWRSGLVDREHGFWIFKDGRRYQSGQMLIGTRTQIRKVGLYRAQGSRRWGMPVAFFHVHPFNLRPSRGDISVTPGSPFLIIADQKGNIRWGE